MSHAWEIFEVTSTRETRIFTAERDGEILGAGEVHNAWTNQHESRPPVLEMIYAVPGRRSEDGPATALISELKVWFPGLAHTGDLSEKGAIFVERHHIPRSPHVRGSGKVLAEAEAEQIGQDLLARARQGQRLP